MLFERFKFKNKLLLTLLLFFIPLILVGGVLSYYQVKNILETSIEKELMDTTDSLVNLITTSASVSIKNRLHAIAEKNLDIASYYYAKHQSGLLTRAEAMKFIEEIFLNQPVGISGYIYCLNSKGIVTVHPNDKVKNSNVSEFDFVRKQIEMKEGYLEYNWKNPEELIERPKVLYMVYFKPLDWIISVSSYREEFSHLVDIDDFRDSVLSFKFGKTGYAYVLSEDGTVVIHPSLQGVNILTQPEYPNMFFKQMLKKKNGKLTYFWKNPDDAAPREKLVIFEYLPDYKWIVASSSYVEEVLSPLATFKNFLLIGLLVGLLSSVAVVYLISASISRPLVSLIDKLEEGSKGDFSVRMENEAPDEFGKLSSHFNSFMKQLEQNQIKIEVEKQKNLEARAALLENDLKLRSLFDQSFQYTGILSPSGVLEEINQSMLDFAGCTSKEVLFLPFWQLPWWRHDPKVQQQLKEAVERATQGEFIRYDTTSISKNDEIKNIDISIKPIFNSSNEVAFIITESRDITAYKLAALERKTLAVQLEKSQKMEAIGTLAGGIAHDFNNILSGIMGYAQLADIHLDNPVKAKGDIGQIVKGAQRAAGLIQQILTFGRQTEYEKQPLNLYLVVKEALKLLRSSIPTTIDISENIVSKSMVLADPTQMHQVIMNLCTNAYHAMLETGGVLTIQLTEVDILTGKERFSDRMKKGKYLKLEIIDTGLGMDDETLSKAFDPYFTTKEVGKGTGFGLALVHAIVEEHDGYVKARSQVGKGSSFLVYLPIIDKNEFQSKRPRENIVTGGTETIMVVDDEEHICKVAQIFLSECGYTVETFEDGAKALAAFEKEPDRFDLVVTDVTMPRMTGIELAKKILSCRKNLPIIMCTGYSETVSEKTALASGIKKYVQKPYSNKSLANSIREILNKQMND